MLSPKTEFATKDDSDDRPKSLKEDGTGATGTSPDAPVNISDKGRRVGVDENEIEDGRALAPEVENPAEQDIEDVGDQTVDLEALRTVSSRGAVHSVFSQNEKRFIIFMTAWAGFFSPVSANIYYPALNSLAKDLHVSDSLINLTLTSYMIFQGLAPTIFGDLADVAGRRPAYVIGFSIYLCANIGLALQSNYAALFVLRCVQSTGSSATIAIAYGIVADISTSAERGSYAGIVTAGMMMGPSLGPVSPQLLQYLSSTNIIPKGYRRCSSRIFRLESHILVPRNHVCMYAVYPPIMFQIFINISYSRSPVKLPPFKTSTILTTLFLFTLHIFKTNPLINSLPFYILR
jgi:MFS family permease